jgi:hypothetical protein
MNRSDLIGCAIMLAMAWSGCYVANEWGTWIGFGTYVVLLALFTSTRAMRKLRQDYERGETQ